MDNIIHNDGSMRRRVLLRDVAKAMRVSVMTVSRALRHDRHVSVALAAKIRATSQRMGYRPDPMLASLVAYRGHLRERKSKSLIAFVTTGKTPSEYRVHRFHTGTLLGAQRRGNELGFQVVPVWLPELEKNFRDPTKVLLARGIQGVILAPLVDLNTPVRLDWNQFSVVALGYSFQKPEFNYAASHLFQDMCLAFDRVSACGYMRPTLIYTADNLRRTLNQLHGAFLFKQSALAPQNQLPPLSLRDANQVETVREYLRTHRPDVIFSGFSDLLQIIKSIGYSIPRELGYVALDTVNYNSQISGIFQDPERIGSAAMDRLNMQLQFSIRGVPHVPEGTIVYGQWIKGRTLLSRAKPVPSRAQRGR
jgi:LacI family transcriptional regulator